MIKPFHKNSVWAKINITEGQLEYNINDKETHTLDMDTPGIIEPTINHRIKPLG